MAKEIERRWLLTKDQLSAIDCENEADFPTRDLINQGYYPSHPPLRVRKLQRGAATTGPTEWEATRWELCIKQGEGLSRDEDQLESLAATECGFLLTHAPIKLSKTRYHRDGWELDVFSGALSGIVTLEREAATEEEALSLTLPDWVPCPEKAVDVTGVLDNLHLATIAAQHGDGALPSFEALGQFQLPGQRAVPKIVLTGGSCAGKSTILDRLRKEGRVQVVPEMATFLIGQLQIRPDEGDPAAFQAALYRTQLVIEHAAEEEAVRLGKMAVVLDRGAMDGAAYIEGGLACLIKAVGSTYRQEQLRYDRVMQLPVPSEAIYDAVKANNPARHHNWAEAKQHERGLRETWTALVGANHVVYRNTADTWQEFEDEVVRSLYAAAHVLRDG